jgi:hypothetical protein
MFIGDIALIAFLSLHAYQDGKLARYPPLSYSHVLISSS